MFVFWMPLLCRPYAWPRYIINPDTVHHLYLLEFKMSYPNAKVIGVEDTITRMNEKSFPFDGREYLLSFRVIAVQRGKLRPCD